MGNTQTKGEHKCTEKEPENRCFFRWHERDRKDGIGLKKKREKKKKMENGRTIDGARQKLDFNVLSFPHRVTLR